ncbi:MAG TPA: DUF2269 family protein [Candidatus Bathyarchaeia archaeon]|nr:DUF2269 family protein [Candidatus Bathyarchaeia archaeon]
MSFEMGVFLGTLTLVLILILIPGWLGGKIAKKLNQKQKTIWLIIHIFFVLIYFSGLFGTLVLVLYTTFTTDAGLIYAVHLFIQLFDWFFLIPGGLGTLVTGVWLSVRTHWGLTKYYWILTKLVLNVATVLFGATLMRVWLHDRFEAIFSANVQPLDNPLYLQNRQMLFVGLAISFTTLLFIVAISYFKPWGKRKGV